MSELKDLIKGVETKLGFLRELKNPGWKVLLLEKGGEVAELDLKDIDQLLLHHPKFGTLVYGQAPGGKSWDQWSFHENGGGGACTIPYVIIDGKLFIGMVKQERPLQSDDPVWNIPRGFIQVGDHDETAKAEFKEETGVKSFNVVRLEGDGVNPNSAFFETWGEDEGVKFYAIPFSEKLLVKAAEDNVYELKEKVEPLDKKEGFLKGLTFFPVEKVSRLGDGFTLAAMGRLLPQVLKMTVKEKK